MRGAAPSPLSPSALATLQAQGAQAEGFSYAMGWCVGTTAGAPSLWHGGSLPGYRTALVLQPEERWGVVVLSNLGSSFEDTTRLIARGVTARLRGLPAPEDGFPLARASRAALAAVALACGLMAWRLARVPRWWARRRPGTADARRRLVARLAVEVLLPLLVLLLVQRLVGLPLWALLEAVPDVTAGLGLLLLLGTLLPVLRLAYVLRAPPAPPRA